MFLTTIAQKSVTGDTVYWLDGDYEKISESKYVKLYNSCVSRKKLVIIPGAGHGLCYLVDPDKYLDALIEFFGLSDSGARAKQHI